MNLSPLITQNAGDKISLPQVDLYIIEPGILVSEYKADTFLDLDLALDVLEATGRISKGKAMPQLFIPGEGQESDVGISQWGTTEEANLYTSAIAIIVKSLPHRIGANFYMKFYKPVRPTRTFSNVNDALAWLTEFI